MSTVATASVNDGTNGSTEHGARRTRIIELLRDSSEPISVEAVAEQVGVHINTARFHLEALVDSGLATRETEVRAQPGRRRVLYTGTRTNQKHQRGRAYQLLASILTSAIVAHYPDTSAEMYETGVEWGRYLTSRPAPYEVFDDADIEKRILDKLEYMWFVAEYQPGPDPHIILHNCPFMETATRASSVVCQLHCGAVNGSLEELRSPHRVIDMEVDLENDYCRGRLGPAPVVPMKHMPLRVINPETEQG